MAKYHVDEAPRVIANIAQRVSIKEKIELSITYVAFSIYLFSLHYLNPFFQCWKEKCVHTNGTVQLLTMIIEYWKMLLKSAVFRGHTLKECLQVIHKDIITVWNFNDPDQVRPPYITYWSRPHHGYSVVLDG